MNSNIERKSDESTYVLILIDDIYCGKRCCRDHDYCADNLDFGECKYGLCNFRLGLCTYRLGLTPQLQVRTLELQVRTPQV
jgi:hypothetical protein